MSSMNVGPVKRPQSLHDLMHEAQRLWKTHQKTGLRFSKALRQLFEADYYRQDGFTQFGYWAEVRFPGITASTARQYSREGAAVIVLERAGRLVFSEEGDDRGAPSVRGVRALATELFKHGPEVMLAIYDAATGMAGAAPVNERHVVKAREGMTTPKDQPDPSTFKPEPEEEIEEGPHYEEHDDLLDKLGELEEQIDRVRAAVENETAVVTQVQLGGTYTKQLDDIFQQLANVTDEVLDAWVAFSASVRES